MAKQKLIVASQAITTICEELDYSRSHVARIMRENHKRLRATFDGQWMMPETSIEALRDLVKRLSGRRYKLGETGPHVRA